MEKDFEGWNRLKEEIHQSSNRPYFHEREVWWCSLGINIGFEIDGKNMARERPVYILRKFNNDTCWALPVSSKKKSGRYYFSYLNKGKEFFINLSQIRLIDAKRLTRKNAILSIDTHEQIKARFRTLLP